MARGVKTGGRKKGTPNKLTGELKDAILKAADLAGLENGLVGYLQTQAVLNPAPFLSLLGKILPMQVGSDPAHPFVIKIERALVRQDAPDSDCTGI